MASIYYEIVWLDKAGKPLSSETEFGENLGAVVRKAARRFLQSPHLIPQDTCGFFALPKDDFDKLVVTDKIRV